MRSSLFMMIKNDIYYKEKLRKMNESRVNFKIIEKHKLMPKPNGLYNLVYLKTHLQD
jgi:hypothetical protein